MQIFGLFKLVKQSKLKRLCLTLSISICIVSGTTTLNASSFVLSQFFPKEVTSNWFIPDLGHQTGTYEVSLGTHWWSDHVTARNLRARLSMNFAPGWRGHMQWRSNREFEGLSRIDPFLDEGYVESLAFYKSPNFQFSQSLKIGRLRYLRFPYPDVISMFDLPPGMEDTQSGRRTSWFQGIAWTSDYSLPVGVGYHNTLLLWLDPERNGIDRPEQFLYYRTQLGWWEFEARWGRLQRRTKPYWRGSIGQSFYSGIRLGDYRVGLLYENVEDEPIRTGILVEFAPSPITELAGTIGLDYTRDPEGVGIQVPITRGSFGFLTEPPDGGELVGEVIAERTITYFENGQGRNFYEHIIEKSGVVSGEGLRIVMTEEPWYLRVESLVSPHNRFESWDDFVAWEEKRQGPAQLAQRVVYRYYR